MDKRSGYTILVDGYNVIHRHSAWHLLPPADGRARLLEVLGRRGWPFPVAEVHVVFDSRGPQPDAPPLRAFGQIRVRFATPSADAELQRMIRAAKDPSTFVVVSDDAEILRTARSHGCLQVPANAVTGPAERARRASRAPSGGEGRHTLPAAEARRITEELARRWGVSR